mmetsp:Transcript_18352/g.51143  ORF Transcript_18352/g.51143 Transcript_18352/m.51143 type:complete len:530 (+) Transcript_18352:539-2128(+)
MSPSSSHKPLEGDPATYEHVQQALFNAGNNTSSGSNTHAIEAVIDAEEHNRSGNIHSKPPSNSNTDAKFSNASVEEMSQASTTKADVDRHSKIMSTSTLPLIPPPSQQKYITEDLSVRSSAIFSSKCGSNEGSTVATKLEAATPIKPRPILIGVKGRVAVTAEGNNKILTTNASTVSAIVQSNETPPVTKTTERSSSAPSTKNKGTARRRGKWTIEEEEYVARVIQDFNSGYLNAPAGYTLRSYLSDKLQCDPMRITKKFTGESCIGKRVFHPAVRSAANAAAIDKAQTELDALERRWRRRLEMQQRESAKKAAASAAAVSAASRGAVTVQGVPVSLLGASSNSPADSQLQQSAVTQAATWLDRANVILMGNIDNRNETNSSFRGKTSNESTQHHSSTSTQSSAEDSLEHQMKEVQRLIYEGPIVQQTTAGLPNLLLQTSASTDVPSFQLTTQAKTTDTIPGVASTSTLLGTMLKPSSSAPVSPTLEPADKRMRTSTSADSDTTGAEDAEALVGFLRSVRASAAAGQEL